MLTVRTVTFIISTAPARAFPAATGAESTLRGNGATDGRPENDGFWPLSHAVAALCQCRNRLGRHPMRIRRLPIWKARPCRRLPGLPPASGCWPAPENRGQPPGQSVTWKAGLPDRMIGRDGKPRPCGSADSLLNYVIPLRYAHPAYAASRSYRTVRADIFRIFK